MTTQSKPALRITGAQYSLFRALLGGYLMVHFAYLLPFAAELFSNQGMLPTGDLSPLFALSPSLFHISDAPWFVMTMVGSGVVAGGALALGRFDRIGGAWLLLLLVSLFARNPLIANPALPYVGFMLLLHLFVPPAPYGSLRAMGRTNPGAGWQLPPHLFWAATVVMAISYSYSGYTKLLSPGWVAGETVALVLENPLARDWWLRDLFLALPSELLMGITWFILVVELLFAPLYLLRKARFGLWLGMLAVQFGFLFLLRFPDLTVGMLLFHLLTFDPRWLAPKTLGHSTLHYDGDCGVCHTAVRFALAEIPEQTLKFRPMQRDASFDAEQVKTWELTTEQGLTFTKTDAAARLLQATGGISRALGSGLLCIPAPLRNGAYNLVARFRRQLSTQPTDLCPLISAEQRERFV